MIRDVIRYSVKPFEAARSFLGRDNLRVPEFGLMGGLMLFAELAVTGVFGVLVWVGRENLGGALPLAMGIYAVGKMSVGLVGAWMESSIEYIP